MSERAHLLEVENLSVEFDTSRGVLRAVDEVSWHLDRGETLAILGESGSGKSVSASAVLGLIDSPPGFITSGRILFEGEDLLTKSEAERRQINGQRIAMIFQDTLASFNPVYTVGWQIAEAFHAHGVTGREAHSRTLELMRRVGIPDPERRIRDYPHQFSGGQRQRLMIAMAIALSPDILLADEPTSALDVTVQAEILKLLKALQKDVGMGMLLITHDLGVAAEVADRVAVMQQGRIVETGPVAEVLGDPQHPYTRRLLAAMPGRDFAPERPQDGDKPLLEVRDLSKSYQLRFGPFGRSGAPELLALDKARFEVFKGETIGIVGESGSGKSTLARTLLRIEQPTSGDALFDGASLYGRAETKSLSRRIQAVFQDPSASLNPRLTVAEIIAEPWEIHPGVLAPRDRPARIAELLEQVGLDGSMASRYPHQFSGGQRQRIAIARAMALRPELIVCDEAVSALDASIQAQVVDLLRDLQRQYGMSYLFITHDLSVVRGFADRIIVMQQGRIVEQGSTRQIFEAPQSDYTRQLLASRPLLERHHFDTSIQKQSK